MLLDSSLCEHLRSDNDFQKEDGVGNIIWITINIKIKETFYFNLKSKVIFYDLEIIDSTYS